MAENEKTAENNPITTLIIDDDSHTRGYIRTFLNSLENMTIQEASLGNEGISMFKKHSPDIVFLDINMPDKNGVTVLKEILAFNEKAHIIMVSGDSTFDNVKISIDSGAKGFIAKPFSAQKFLDAIEGVTG